MRIDMIVSDIDGTLTGNGGQICPDVQAGVVAVMRSGVRFSLATGRRRKMAVPVARQLGLRDPIIVFDGAAIVDPISGRCLDRQLMVPDLVTAALAVLRAEASLRVYVQEDPEVGDGVFAQSEGDRQYLVEAWPSMCDDALVVPDLLEGRLSAVRVLAFGEARALSRAAMALSSWPGRVMLWSAWPTAVLECYAPGVDKGSGLLRLCGLLGIDVTAVAAFGDDLNDVSLLSVAGVPIAMGNAHPELLRQVPMVCDDVDRTGIGKVLLSIAANGSLRPEDLTWFR